MTHAFCGGCGTHLYQCPADAGFRAIYPSTVHATATARPLPAALQPKQHINRENKHYDFNIGPPTDAAAEPVKEAANIETRVDTPYTVGPADIARHVIVSR